MRVHLIGLPHVHTTKEYFWDAFGQKLRKASTMLQSLPDVDVTLYTGYKNEADCAEHVVVMSKKSWNEHFGDWDWKKDVFNRFDATEPFWKEFNRNCIKELAKRIEPGDIVGLSMGLAHKPIYDAINPWAEAFFVEHAIGYPGVFAPYRIYESYAWRHHIAGIFVGRGNKNWLGQHEDDTARMFDLTCGNYFETESFPEGDGSGGYFLFVGRLTERKGPMIAALACQRIGAKLIVAGQGDFDALGLPGDVEYVGLVNEKERCELMMGAVAQFAPSLYLEPFCAASVEPLMCSTPSITSDWGAMTENVIHGFNGFRCNTLAEFAKAAEMAPLLDRTAIRKHAQETWSTDVLKWKHLDYFNQLQTLRDGAGWYT